MWNSCKSWEVVHTLTVQLVAVRHLALQHKRSHWCSQLCSQASLAASSSCSLLLHKETCHNSNIFLLSVCLTWPIYLDKAQTTTALLLTSNPSHVWSQTHDTTACYIRLLVYFHGAVMTFHCKKAHIRGAQQTQAGKDE